jgi:hypothetical protein
VANAGTAAMFDVINIAKVKIVANAVVMVYLLLFFLLRLRFISVPSTDTIDKRIPHLIGQVTQKNT